jgi:DNA-binding protein WhiA
MYDAEIDGEQLTSVYSHEETAHVSVQLTKFAYGRDAQECFIRRGAHKYTSVSFASKNAIKKLSLFIKTRDQSIICECPECSFAFLRGVFMVAGSVNAPDSTSHLELKLRHPDRAGALFDILGNLDLLPLISHKASALRLYFKNRSAVQDFMSCIGCNQAVFEMVNLQLQKDLRNDENRATNCVTRNINRSITASGKQLSAIRRIDELGLLPAMPEKLQATARLRLDNPEASFEELAALHTPPISKSGANHRLEKIMAWYEQHVKK